jgi:NodT family efflux transporter outer membrane factor (OMF) lipoprotein
MSTSARNSRRRTASLGVAALGVAALAVAALGAAGCAVGPTFHRPAAPAVTQYTQDALPATTAAGGGTAQRFTSAEAISADWWRVFRSAALESIIREALAKNPGLEAAQANLRASHDELRSGYGIFYPAVDADAAATRERYATVDLGQTTPGSVFNLFTVGASVSYALDLFGGERRLIEQLHAEVDVARATEQATYITLIANVVNTVVARAAYQAELDSTARLVDIQQDQVHLAEVQERAGIVSYSSLLTQRSQLAAYQADIAQLRLKLAQTDDLLASLCGHTSGDWSAPPVSLAELSLPDDLPLSLPSDLVRQRPDILVAEATAHAASANVGVATAALFPSITLSGAAAAASNNAHALFPANGRAWSVGAAATVPLFQGGTVWYKRKAAIDEYQQTMALYRQTVLGAFAQVADTLHALDQDAQAQLAQDAARDNAALNLALVRANYSAGTAGFADVLGMDAMLQQATVSDVQATAVRYQDSVALYAALGGGWWNAATPPRGNP